MRIFPPGVEIFQSGCIYFNQCGNIYATVKIVYNLVEIFIPRFKYFDLVEIFQSRGNILTRVGVVILY